MPKHRYDRLAWRCAEQINEVLHRTRRALLLEQARSIQAVLEQLQVMHRVSHQLTRSAADTRLSAASNALAHRLRYQILSASRELQLLAGQGAPHTGPSIPTLAEILGELNQLEHEFGSWQYDRRSKQLCVITDPISLQGVALGRFKISVCLMPPLSGVLGQWCTVEALDPHPAASNDEVTHPHVSGQGICVGDAGTEFVRALRSGRVCDFFLMIRSVLNTYNAASPYVSLEDWEGETCEDCGRSVAEEDRCSCEDCARCVCDECITGCHHCDSSTCYGCISTCTHCEKSSCADCLSPCLDCGDRACPNCIKDNLCPTCMEDRDDNEEQEQESKQQEDTQSQTAHQ